MQPSEITLEMLEHAEGMAGLALEPQERAVVLERLLLLAKARGQLRERSFENGFAPAPMFDPRMAGRDYGRSHPVVRFAPLEAAKLDRDETEIAFAPLGRLLGWLEAGELTSVELTGLYLSRLRRFGSALEAVVTLTEQRALEAAERADRERAQGHQRGALAGLPWGAKDLLDTAGIATTFGAAPYRDRVPSTDAEVVRRLDRAGAVLVAKLSLGELAQGDVWFGGRTRNPHAPADGSGGSSAGPGAAVAAGLVGFAIGSETLGSIANPSLTCGVVGLRPTYGRVPRSGAMALSWSLDKLGPMARSVEDTARVLQVIAGAHPGDEGSLDLPFFYDGTRPVRGLRVGFVPRWFERASAPERAALDALRAAGAVLHPLELPKLPTGFVYTILLAETAAAFETLTRGEGLETLEVQTAGGWPAGLRSAHFLTAVEYVQAQRLRRLWMGELDARFTDLDALIAPGMGQGLLPVTNATGHPALTLPVGLLDGKPAAVTLYARLFDEETLFLLGRALERELGPAPRPAGYSS